MISRPPLRVVLFKPYREEQWVSSEVFAKSLASVLVSISSFLQVRVLSPGERFFSKALRGFKLRFLVRYFLYPLLAFFRQDEINHILDSSYAHAALFLDPQRTIITCHDVIPLRLFRIRRPTWKEWVRLKFYRLSLQFLSRVQAVVAVSESTKRDLVELLGIPTRNIRVIHQGVGGEFRPIRDRRILDLVRKKYELPSRFILHVGHNYYYKNVELLLRLVHELRNREETADVYFVKVGPEFSFEQREQIKKLGIADRIVRLSRVPTSDLVVLYNLASLLVQPSLFEGFSLTILEAMACGCPVVASRIPTFQELYRGAIHMAPLQPEKDFLAAVSGLVKDNKRRLSLVGHGKLRAARFTWKRAARAYLSLYRAIHKRNPVFGARHLLEERSLLVRGGISALVFGGLAKFAGILWRLLAVRMGTSAFGLFSIAFTYINILTALAVFGLPVAVIRSISFYKRRVSFPQQVEVLGSSLAIVFSIGAFILSLAFGLRREFTVGFLNRAELLPLFSLLAFAIPLLSISEVLLSAVNAVGFVRRFFLVKSVLPATVRLISLLFLLWFWKYSVDSVAMSVLVSAMALCGASLFLVLRIFPGLFRQRLRLRREFFRFLLPVSVAHTIQSFSSSIDIVLLSFFLSPSPVGVYSAASVFLPLLRILPESFLEFFSSAFTLAAATQKAPLGFFTWSVKLLFILSLPPLLFLLIGRKFLVHLFLPPEFSATSPLLALLAIALFVRWVIIVPSRKVIDVLGRSDISLGLTMVEVLLSISLGLPLIRAFGITGAAAMMLSVSGILALLAIFIVFGLKTKRIALKL